MTEMVARVTEAIAEAWELWNQGDGHGKSQADVPVDILALAAVAAMAEPTGDMLTASADLPNGKAGTYQIWQAMIDAALLSPPRPRPANLPRCPTRPQPAAFSTPPCRRERRHRTKPMPIWPAC